ncbi:putative bifunctional diguanylate cyclase/phosphodiesterase [Methylomarinum vadi]|uniref:putative bifunctional diguanylate cyclase/phosphodiesterase n=1 Tax=Methylomarinum vadi TaxID=438855 RepID=UPI0022857D7E|nr:bifunctional diguanylate cyclase/phosphodiesterase [Methylomarinum vadi]
MGHQVGDELLIQVAQRISTLLREEDTACRLGGDEFIVLVAGQGKSLEQATDHAAILAEKIRDVINQPFMLRGSSHHFTTSIGVSIYPDITEQPEAVIQQADTAMYRAKEMGRNSISFFRPSMQKLADQRLILEKEMREALLDGHFALFYQPQVDRDGRIVSVEALIRWRNPEKGMISPADFIPVAEETQLILPIGSWVLNEACRQINFWDNENRYIGHVAVNVSSRQFRQPDFVEQVENILVETGIEASRLMIELTEGVVIDNIEDTVDKMQALKRMGVGISIDDFGTGYSSLSYLKQLPISQLKIDQNFVRDIVSDPNDAVIVETIINMAHNLELNVIAEGVENQAQMDYLLAKGCVHFQGYFFGRPVEASELEIREVGR